MTSTPAASASTRSSRSGRRADRGADAQATFGSFGRERVAIRLEDVLIVMRPSEPVALDDEELLDAVLVEQLAASPR